MSRVIEFGDRETLDNTLAQEVENRLKSAIEQRGKAYLVVSGGTTPINLFTELASRAIAWGNITLVLSDERFVCSNHENSNERMLREQLLRNSAKSVCLISLIPRPGDARENILIVNQSMVSIPKFDVVLLGMGDDAHTASLFPCAGELAHGLETSKSALILKPKNAPHTRISLSKRRLLNTRYGAIHIVGKAKKMVFDRVTANPDIKKYPITAFTGPEGFECWWAP